DGLSRLAMDFAGVSTVEDETQRAHPEEVTVDFEFRQRVAELLHRRRRRVVYEHLLGLRVRRDVVHERHALVEEMTSPHPQLTAHSIVRNALPFETGDELARDGVQITKHMGERVAWRLLQR